MSESSQASCIDALASLRIIENPDGTITRDPARFKDIVVNHSKFTCMRLYVPTTVGVSSEKLPLVVFYRGGDFTPDIFDLALVHGFCNSLALRSNVVVASASYRKDYDDGVEDLEWLRNSEDEWIKSHADLSNVFLMGNNSGGKVAYKVGLRSTEQDLTPLRIRGLILLEPFFHAEELEPFFHAEDWWESELRHVNHQHFPTTISDIFWETCTGSNDVWETCTGSNVYWRRRVGDGPDNMEKIERLGWKVMVTGEGGGAMLDRQRDVARLMKEKGFDVIEHFIEGGDPNETETMFDSIIDGGDPNKTETMFASITSLIYSCR